MLHGCMCEFVFIYSVSRAHTLASSVCALYIFVLSIQYLSDWSPPSLSPHKFVLARHSTAADPRHQIPSNNMKFSTPIAAVAMAASLALLPSVSAHGPKSQDDVVKFLDQQHAAYHCAPAIAAMTAARKKSWAQKVLGGDSVENKNLFIDGYFEDLGIDGKVAAKGLKALEEKGKRIMACDPVVETSIRNSTCVLSPETTPGPTTTLRSTPFAPTWPSGSSVFTSRWMLVSLTLTRANLSPTFLWISGTPTPLATTRVTLSQRRILSTRNQPQQVFERDCFPLTPGPSRTKTGSEVPCLPTGTELLNSPVSSPLLPRSCNSRSRQDPQRLGGASQR